MINPNEKSEIVAELRKISSLLTVIATDGKTREEKIQVFDQLGMTHQQIGDIVGSTKNAVQKTLKRLQNKEVNLEINGK